jgi:hypothetical protein
MRLPAIDAMNQLAAFVFWRIAAERVNYPDEERVQNSALEAWERLTFETYVYLNAVDPDRKG